MVRFRSGMALAILVIMLAGCGGESDSGGTGLVALPTRTPAPVTDPPAENADSAGDTSAPTVHLTATQFGLGTASALGWAADASQLLVSGMQTGWAYDAAGLDSAPTALDSAWSGSGTFSPQGTLIAAAPDGDQFALWEVESSTRLFALENTGEQAWHVTFSPDESRAAAVIMPSEALQSATDTIVYDPENGVVPPDSVIRVWEIDSGTVSDYPLPDDRVLDLALIDDGRVIVVGSAENVTRYEYAGPNQDPRAIPPTSNDMDVRLWDLDRPDAPITTITGLEHGIPSATLSADGRTLTAPVLAATSQYGTDEWRLNLWDATTGDLLAQFDPDSTGAYTVRAFSPDSTILAAVVNARDNEQSTRFTIDQVWLWDVASGEPVTILESAALTGEGDDQIRALSFTPDGSQLAALTFDGAVLVWATAPPADGDGPHLPLALRADFTGSIAAVTLDASASTIFASSSGNMLRTWDTSTGLPGDPIVAAQPATELFSGPRDLLIGKVGQTFARVQIWDAATHEWLNLLRNTSGSLRFMALSPDGSTVATSRGGGTVTLYNATTPGTNGVILATHQVSALAYSPDGSLLATGGLDGTLKLIEIDSGDEIATISAHNGAITDLAFSADGKTLTSASLRPIVMEAESFGETTVTTEPDYSVRRFDIETRTLDGTLELGEDPALIARLSGDGSRVAFVMAVETGSATLTVQAVGDAAPLVVQAIDGASVTALAFSADGSQIVTGHTDGTITLWTVDAGD